MSPESWPRDRETGMGIPAWKKGTSMAGDAPDAREQCPVCWELFGMTFYHRAPCVYADKTEGQRKFAHAP